MKKKPTGPLLWRCHLCKGMTDDATGHEETLPNTSGKMIVYVMTCSDCKEKTK